MSGRLDRLDAGTVWLFYRFVFRVCEGMIYTAVTVYYVTTAHLNPLQLVLVGTAVEAGIFVFEVPTGVIADTYGRRISLIIGTALFGAAFIAEGLLPFFAAIVATQIVRGVGHTLMSGAPEAWLAGEVGEERFGGVLLRGTQAGRLGTLVGIAGAAVVGSVRINLAVVAGGALAVALASLLAVIMPEAGFARASRSARHSHWSGMRTTLQDGIAVVRGRPLLVLLLIVTVLGGVASEGYDRLEEPYMLTYLRFPAAGRLQPVVWFAFLAIGTTLLGILATELLRKRLDMTDDQAMARTLSAFTAARLGCIVALGLSGRFWPAAGAAVTAAVLRSLIQPVLTAWSVRMIDPRVRATVLSMLGQADASGQIGGGPVVGLIGLRASLRAAIVVSGLVLAPAAGLFFRMARRWPLRAAPRAVYPPPPLGTDT